MGTRGLSVFTSGHTEPKPWKSCFWSSYWQGLLMLYMNSTEFYYSLSPVFLWDFILVFLYSIFGYLLYMVFDSSVKAYSQCKKTYNVRKQWNTQHVFTEHHVVFCQTTDIHTSWLDSMFPLRFIHQNTDESPKDFRCQLTFPNNPCAHPVC